MAEEQKAESPKAGITDNCKKLTDKLKGEFYHPNNVLGMFQFEPYREDSKKCLQEFQTAQTQSDNVLSDISTEQVTSSVILALGLAAGATVGYFCLPVFRSFKFFFVR